MVAATASIAVFALLQGVDGVALKKMVDLWTIASREEQAVAFRVAESVRWIEIGINSYFRIVNGATLLLFALAIVVGAGFPRWVRWFGWVGVATGLAWIVGGVAVGYSGFSTPTGIPTPVWLAVTTLSGWVYLLWVPMLGVLMWFRSRKISAGARSYAQARSGTVA